MAQRPPRHRPFTPAQQRQNAAFLAALRRTGNVRLACRELNVHRATYTKRRGKCAAFATEWDMVLAAAHAAFQLAGGVRLPEAASPLPDFREGPGVGTQQGSDPQRSENLRTKGGEPMIVRLGNGRLQLRLAPPGRMTDAAERHYLAALAASANIRLAARATGFAHSSFYARRDRWVGFRMRMSQSLAIGYDRIEYVVMERTLQAFQGVEEQGWLGAMIRDNPLPPLSFNQAFQTLCLHRNTVRLDGMRPPGRPSKVEPSPQKAMFAIGCRIDAIQRANHYHATGSWTLAEEPAAQRPALPPLALVTGLAGRSGSEGGWGAKATVKVTYNAGRALFGGWRIEDWEKRKKAG